MHRMVEMHATAHDLKADWMRSPAVQCRRTGSTDLRRKTVLYSVRREKQMVDWQEESTLSNDWRPRIWSQTDGMQAVGMDGGCCCGSIMASSFPVCLFFPSLVYHEHGQFDRRKEGLRHFAYPRRLVDVIFLGYHVRDVLFILRSKIKRRRIGGTIFVLMLIRSSVLSIFICCDIFKVPRYLG